MFLINFIQAGRLNAQSDSEYSGMWKCYAKVSGLKADNSKTDYLLLNADHTYKWGIDSSLDEPLKNVTEGNWNITEDGEIEFIPGDTLNEIRYYVPKGEGKYEYRYSERNGKKTLIQMLEMDFFIEKVHQ